MQGYQFLCKNKLQNYKKTLKVVSWDHSEMFPVQYLENILAEIEGG